MASEPIFTPIPGFAFPPSDVLAQIAAHNARKTMTETTGYGDDIDATDEEKYGHLTHDSHDMSEGSCMGCGAVRMHELVEPCPNARCSRCGQLHGIDNGGWLCGGCADYCGQCGTYLAGGMVERSPDPSLCVECFEPAPE